jgi:hypothetical protein
MHAPAASSLLVSSPLHIEMEHKDDVRDDISPVHKSSKCEREPDHTKQSISINLSFSTDIPTSQQCKAATLAAFDTCSINQQP